MREAIPGGRCTPCSAAKSPSPFAGPDRVRTYIKSPVVRQVVRRERPPVRLPSKSVRINPHALGRFHEVLRSIFGSKRTLRLAPIVAFVACWTWWVGLATAHAQHRRSARDRCRRPARHSAVITPSSIRTDGQAPTSQNPREGKGPPERIGGSDRPRSSRSQRARVAGLGLARRTETTRSRPKAARRAGDRSALDGQAFETGFESSRILWIVVVRTSIARSYPRTVGGYSAGSAAARFRYPQHQKPRQRARMASSAARSTRSPSGASCTETGLRSVRGRWVGGRTASRPTPESMAPDDPTQARRADDAASPRRWVESEGFSTQNA